MKDLNTIKIYLNSKDGREVVDSLLKSAAVPGALIGRAKNGSAALVFRSTRRDLIPSAPGANRYQQVFDLATNNGAIRITISTDSAAPAGDYRWDRAVPHYELSALPETAATVGTRIIKAAFDELDFSWASIVDDNLAREELARKLHADLAAGRVKIPAPEEMAAEAEAKRDAEIVKNTEGREYSQFDGYAAQQIIGARARHAARLEKVQAEHAAELQAERQGAAA